jgi:hypothetical protein
MSEATVSGRHPSRAQRQGMQAALKAVTFGDQDRGPCKFYNFLRPADIWSPPER